MVLKSKELMSIILYILCCYQVFSLFVDLTDTKNKYILEEKCLWNPFVLWWPYTLLRDLMFCLSSVHNSVGNSTNLLVPVKWPFHIWQTVLYQRFAIFRRDVFIYALSVAPTKGTSWHFRYNCDGGEFAYLKVG